MTRKRKWLLRSASAVVLALVAVGTWAGLNATALKARYAAHQFRTATTDGERAIAADRLMGLGSPGLTQLIELIRGDEDDHRTAAAEAIGRHLASVPDGDQRAVLVAAQVLDAFAGSNDRGRRAILELLPMILKQTGTTYAGKCREAIASGLKSPEVATRVLAIRLALHPEVRMRTDLLPLLTDREVRVRQAALFAAASVTDGELLLTDEELFHWLHDPDEGMRKVCYDALVSRDRSEVEIGLARRLSHPDPAERLKLLLDLRYDDDVADPEPWLERLSRDPEPAVRAGAARIVLEIASDRKLTCPGWVARVASGDPSPTVRRIATYFHHQPTRRTPVEVRSAGGP